MTIATVRDSWLFKVIADISVVHWIISTGTGAIPAGAAFMHGKSLEQVIAYFSGVAAAMLMALHYGAKLWPRGRVTSKPDNDFSAKTGFGATATVRRSKPVGDSDPHIYVEAILRKNAAPASLLRLVNRGRGVAHHVQIEQIDIPGFPPNASFTEVDTIDVNGWADAQIDIPGEAGPRDIVEAMEVLHESETRPTVAPIRVAYKNVQGEVFQTTANLEFDPWAFAMWREPEWERDVDPEIKPLTIGATEITRRPIVPE